MNQRPASGEPGATYRLQFNSGFRFVDGRDLAPYLSELGITDMYSSPRYKARRGSSHGYDIANPLRVNPELGTEEDFNEMAEKLRHYGMGLLLDTVPNHMAASYENPWWTDVLENGPSSPYAGYFDIDWHPATTKAAFLQDNRVLLPVLGDLYGNVLEKGELSLKYEDTGMQVRYYETRLPLDPGTYVDVLERCLADSPGLPNLRELMAELTNLPSRNDPDPERILARRRLREPLKERLWRAYQGSPELKNAIDLALLQITGSPDALDSLLSRQAYRLAFWKIGYEEINYRRFFDINELVGIRVESPEVFEDRYSQTLQLVREGKITGLRIDHIDGLWDPDCFLKRLQSAASDDGGIYLAVEKILGRGEELPAEWPVSGTTGYEYLNAVNGLFIHPEGLKRLEKIYGRRTGNLLPFAELCYASNKQVIESLFYGDLNALGHHLGRLAAEHRQARDIPLSELMRLLIEVTACLPVYRTYIHSFDVSASDRGYIERTLALARRRTVPHDISDAAFEFLASILLISPPPYLDGRKPEWLAFVMRWQQFTGPVMAKGLEDTANYRHNSLLSLSEVGGDPLREYPPFTVDEFHAFNARRLARWPGSLNATATHDTKRGEDVRARLNVLTEMPAEWDRHLDSWMEWNAASKSSVSGVLAPSANEEFLIYQTLLGAWPANSDEESDFAPRVREFLIKALREAKQNSSWIEPREEYERAVLRFVDTILAGGSRFLEDLKEFHSVLSRYGAINGLSQLVLKLASPGCPDFYQGTELWQFALVDPDNRRPVDYKRRSAMLDELRRRVAEDPVALLRSLAADPRQDETKLFVTYRGLACRKERRDLFARGEYIPVRARGKSAAHVCAFARRAGGQWVMAVAPRWLSRLKGWGDTRIMAPPGAPKIWKDAITGLTPSSLRLEHILAEFPVALLTED
jgi:(1->4)-alpha-D-glucan 1-alpha-D-glucosylmutase